MANTLTISISPQDAEYLDQNPGVSPTKLFRSAMRLEKGKEQFMDIYDIYDYNLILREHAAKFLQLQQEIQRRQERIESLQDVLAQKELTERRLRKTSEANNGLIPESSITKDRF